MNKTIVIIDDDNTLLTNLTDFFSKKGYEVFGAISPQKGLEYVYGKKPSAILLDMIMPEMNGIDVIKDIANTDKSFLEKITVITNTSDMTYLSQAIELGVINYLVKSDMSLESIFKKVDERVA